MVIAGIMIAIGVGTLAVFGIEIMAVIMTVAGIVWMIVSIVEHVRERPTIDIRGKFHDGTTGQFISRETFLKNWAGIVAAILLPIMIKAETFAQVLPFLVFDDPLIQLVAAFVTNGIG